MREAGASRHLHGGLARRAVVGGWLRAGRRQRTPFGLLRTHLDPGHSGHDIGDDRAGHRCSGSPGGGLGLDDEVALAGFQMRHPVFKRPEARVGRIECSSGLALKIDNFFDFATEAPKPYRYVPQCRFAYRLCRGPTVQALQQAIERFALARDFRIDPRQSRVDVLFQRMLCAHGSIISGKDIAE